MSSAKTTRLTGALLILAATTRARAPFNTIDSNALAVRTSEPSVTAVCSSEWSWMDNGKSQSPCLVAAWVSAPCASSLTWSVPALTSGIHYDAPNATTANACTCSWSAYNLLAACTACQNFSGSIQTWGTWRMSCSEFLSSTTYFPSDQGYTLPSETAIPFWAGQNPQMQWHDAIFNVSQAQAIESQGHADLTGVAASTTASSSSKLSVGAIVGGVIGGLAIILITSVSCACGLIRRHQGLQRNYYQNKVNRPDTIELVRSTSDASLKFMDPNDLGMMPARLSVLPQVMGSMPLMSAPIPQTWALPTLSPGLSPESIPSATMQSFGYAMSPNFNTSTYTTPSQPNREDIITPFVSGQTSPNSVGHKNARSTGSPGSSHDFSEDGYPAIPHRARMNPPAYTARAGTGEVQALAPTLSEDPPGRRKHTYEPSADPLSRGATLDENRETAAGTGLADYGSLFDTMPKGGSRWGGSTIAGSSERESTVVGDFDSQKRSPNLQAMDILGES